MSTTSPKKEPNITIKDETKEDSDENEKMHMVIEEWPTKCISFVSEIEVLCQVEFIDFEGRSDGDSIKKLIGQIRPKQLVIIHGSAAATRNLADYCRENKLVQGNIFTPTLGEVVDATIESHIFQVTLSDQLMNSLFFQAVKDAELSWVDARLLRKKAIVSQKELELANVIELDDGAEKQEPMDTSTTEENQSETNARKQAVVIPDQLYLEALPSSSIPPHQSVFVNDPKLTDLKQLLTNSGFQAEFNSGVLFVNNVASVRRNEAGRFHVEGYACEDYYKIREIVYSQFAIV